MKTPLNFIETHAYTLAITIGGSVIACILIGCVMLRQAYIKAQSAKRARKDELDTETAVCAELRYPMLRDSYRKAVSTRRRFDTKSPIADEMYNHLSDIRFAFFEGVARLIGRGAPLYVDKFPRGVCHVIWNTLFGWTILLTGWLHLVEVARAKEVQAS
ncbi:MAG: hypothetical protein WCG97_00500 [bacterium]